MDLTITIPSEKLDALKAILVYTDPDYSSKTNAEIKDAQEDALLNQYRKYISGLNDDKLEADKQATNRAQVSDILG